MRVANLLQPHYIFRPSQVLRRVARSFRRAPDIADVRVPWGAKLQVDTREVIGHWILWKGLWDIAVCEALWRLLRPGDVAVDAGANIGCMTTLMAARVGPAGRVFAFEPHPVVRQRLELNVGRTAEQPGFAPVKVVPVALSAEDGVAHLAMGDDFHVNQGVARIVDAANAAGPSGAAGGTFTVPTRRLDDELAGQRIRVMKVDVEGHEAALFAGASGLLERGAITHVIYEDNRGGGSPVHDFLAERGYAIFALGWRRLGPALAGRHESLTHPGETPDFIATRDAGELERAMKARGYLVLRGATRG